MGDIGFDTGGGGGLKKIIEWEGDPQALPAMGNPVTTRPHCFINKKCFAVKGFYMMKV